MKKKLLSVIAAAALAVTSFAAFSVTAMAATCPNCGSTNVSVSVEVAATCASWGVTYYYCNGGV